MQKKRIACVRNNGNPFELFEKYEKFKWISGGFRLCYEHSLCIILFFIKLCLPLINTRIGFQRYCTDAQLYKTIMNEGLI